MRAEQNSVHPTRGFGMAALVLLAHTQERVETDSQQAVRGEWRWTLSATPHPAPPT